LERKVAERVEEMRQDDLSHYLIYQARQKHENIKEIMYTLQKGVKSNHE
jgi:hypothetical protein